LLTSDEALQLLDPVHGFFLVITVDLGLFFLVAEPGNLITGYLCKGRSHKKGRPFFHISDETSELLPDRELRQEEPACH